ncbi:NfeD family protein [Leptotrichia sp. oral taxon 221]|uniref:NfeD family protein n=1 Tax=Leptotrichia sp. oral taxon 221 TaxID=712362 RepID=UPI001B8C35D7|nr:NfeD family protein [Leptotrichia sp. oral taxon 221]QUB96774.1 NfeD family protein [Leptotrichia sp. oral taxon 221]
MGALFWTMATAIFSILEIVIPGLVTIWLALAALILTAISFFIKNPNIEFVIFTVLSIVFVIFTRPVLKKYLEDKKTNFSSKMVGQELKIEKVVDLESPKKVYEVKFKGVIWKGVSSEIFREGEIVKIEDFEGNKIILEKIKK